MSRVKYFFSTAIIFCVSIFAFDMFFAGVKTGDMLLAVECALFIFSVLSGVLFVIPILWNRKFGKMMARRVGGEGFRVKSYAYWYWSAMFISITLAFVVFLIRYGGDGREFTYIFGIAFSAYILSWFLRVIILSPDGGAGIVTIREGEITLDFSEKLHLVRGSMEIIDDPKRLRFPGFIIRGEWDVEKKKIFGESVHCREEREVIVTSTLFGNANPDSIRSILGGKGLIFDECVSLCFGVWS